MKPQASLLTGLLLALVSCVDTGLGPTAASDARAPEVDPGNAGTRAGRLTLNPMSAVIEVGSSILFRTMIRGTPGDGLAWSVSDTAIARVDPDGVVTALRPGETTLSVTSRGGDGAGLITVEGPEPLVAAAGLRWRSMVSGEGLAPIYDVWGSSATDVFAVGSSLLWNCCATILHFDGSGWSYMSVPGGVFELHGVWGSSDRDVFAVGAPGAVLHYDGETWSRMPIPTEHALLGVWGSSPTDVFAVGFGGVILHYDGARWITARAPDEGGTTWLTDVWGTSAGDVFAVGSGVLHYDGRSWSPMTTPPVVNLVGVWGTAGDDVFAVGVGGVILHYDGRAWSQMVAPERDGDLLGVWGNAADDVYAVGDRNWWGPGGCCSDVLHFDGTTWRVLQIETGQALFDAWTTEDAAFIVGSGPTIVRGIH